MPKYSVWIFLVGVFLLEVNRPASSINVGNLLLLSGAGLATVISFFHRKRVGVSLKLRLFDVIYLFYLLWLLTTAFWAPSPLDTVVGVLYLFGVWVAIFSLSYVDYLVVVKSVVSLTLVTAISSIMIMVISPDVAYQPHASTSFPELRGVMNHQLRLGVAMSIGFGFVFFAILNGDLKKAVPRFAGIVLLVLGVVMVLAFARIYTLVMLISMVGCYLYSVPGRRRFTGATVFLIFSCLSVIFFPQIEQIVINSGIDLTMNGRTLTWERSIEKVFERPMAGFGYSSFNQPVFDYLFPYYRPDHMHNSYLQSLFETGVVGLVFTLILVVMHFRASLYVGLKTQRFSYSLFLVFFTFLGSFTGANYASKPTQLFVLMLFMVSVEYRCAKKA